MGAPRCTSCSKFVPIELGEPEISETEIDEENNIIGQVRLIKNCGECDQEMAEAYVDVEIEVAERCKCDTTLEVDEETAESTDEGGGRYKKRMIGADLTYTLSCPECNKTFTATGHVEEAAGNFDDCQ